MTPKSKSPISYLIVQTEQAFVQTYVITKNELVKLLTKYQEAIKACGVFITPIARRKDNWDEYKEDAARRIRELS